MRLLFLPPQGAIVRKMTDLFPECVLNLRMGRGIMSSLLPLLLLVSLVLPITAFEAEADVINFTVSPSIVEFSTVKGATRIFTLFIYNQGDSPLNIKTSVSNYVLDEEGIPHLVSTSSESSNWARYVKLDEDTFSVGPREGHQLRAVLKAPRGKVGGGYFAVIFNARVKTKDRKTRGDSVILGGQLPVIFLGEITRTGTHKARIVYASINPGPYSSEKPMVLRFLLQNTGTTHIRARGTVLLRDERGKVLDRVKLESGSGLILPKGRRHFTGKWPKAAKYKGRKITADLHFRFPGGRVNKKLPLPSGRAK